MNTPIYNFIKKYDKNNILRCHMPGHKGRYNVRETEMLCRFDITEISGADSLFEAEGIILESEKNMSRLYNTAATLYSAGGSTLCIQGMLGAMRDDGRRIIAVRNVHRAFLNSAALLGLEVEWVMPNYKNGILSGEISLEAIEDKLKSGGKACVYVTSPDYTGRMADIGAISEICRRYGALLIVDNAHGAHLHFLPKSLHPIALGADICCDSAHKMLPALTGAAMLHMADRRFEEPLRRNMGLFGSTSPSYLIMMSLDLCLDYLDNGIRRDIEENLMYADKFRQRFENRLDFVDGDPFHITTNAAESGFSGNELAELLRGNGVECEYSDDAVIILLMSPMNRAGDYSRLEASLESALSKASRKPREPQAALKSIPKKAMNIREAVFSPCEEIPVERAEGRICAAVKVPCPPAVPIAVSGEIIDGNCIEIFRSYGIKTVLVCK